MGRESLGWYVAAILAVPVAFGLLARSGILDNPPQPDLRFVKSFTKAAVEAPQYFFEGGDQPEEDLTVLPSHREELGSLLITHRVHAAGLNTNSIHEAEKLERVAREVMEYGNEDLSNLTPEDRNYLERNTSIFRNDF